MEKTNIFFRMIASSIDGKYKPNKWNILIAILSFIYVISPFDFISEFPFALLGLIDDAAIIAFAYSRISKEMERFIEWERNKKLQID